jgi:DNA-binding transcriptional LysR family regulator
MTPELRHLRCFVATAEELNFTRAARRLHVAQQALSTTVRQLEAQLEVQLFVRSTREVHLTCAGGAFLVEARRVLETADAAFASLDPVREGLTGRLALGSSPAARHGVADRVGRAYMTARPQVEVGWREAFGRELLADVLDRRIDVALVFCADEVPGARYELIKTEPVMTLTRPDDSLAERGDVTLDELRERTWVVAAHADLGHRAMLTALARTAGFAPRFRVAPMLVHETEYDLAPGEVAIVVPSSAGPSLDRLPVVPLMPACVLPFHIVTRDEPPAPVLRAFLSVAHQTATADGWPAHGAAARRAVATAPAHRQASALP